MLLKLYGAIDEDLNQSGKNSAVNDPRIVRLDQAERPLQPDWRPTSKEFTISVC